MFNPAELSVADVFARLATELHDSDGVDETVDAVVEFAVRALSCSHAGVVFVARGGRPEIAAVSDPAIRTIYECQIDVGDGPMVESLREGAVVHIPDAKADPRWPSWSELVSGFGIHSVLHLPLAVTDRRVGGVLSVYSTAPAAFTADDEAVAHILARHAAVALSSAREEASLAQAVDARKLIGQAMGILMERFDLDADRAFEVLKRYSQDGNIKLREVAQQLVDTRKLPRS
ncbi:GAF and ANTAR domain-containing protein [Kribbella qitaiheensis]|uniref:GAF and ANTAR domain-containing protein n=2 Tax=Kribbella qitaiheensis TaxID=1544730 RepID=A0A7G6X8Y2_9ACTN|nr:GAF and ANTAR domain-containing protein [Kribbella qitaiheensis]QNE22697.1 GAF and ANTAR domain-containing protein [Kribbella qitaiheensis]